MSILVLNCGSSSVKFEVLADDYARIVDGAVEAVGEESGGRLTTRVHTGGETATDTVASTFADHEAALSAIVDRLGGHGHLRDLRVVGHRMVHGGETFTDPTVIDDDVIEVLEGLSDLAPLHNPPALAGIRAARTVRPDVPHVAVFDTAFHATLAPEAYRYAVPTAWYADHGVRRYGFHGTSHDVVSRRAAAFLDQPVEDLRMITLHLGNGASACAIDGGRSVDTSMGLTPLEGLVMGTRSGDIDPAIPFHLLRRGMDAEEVEDALNRRSGLKGLCGDNDLRAVLARDDEEAALALAVMTRRLRGYVGQYLAHLGGLDALVFTAGIGEHSAAVRAAVVEPLHHLGLWLDAEANDAVDLADGPVRISPAGAPVHVLVVATDEERRIAECAVEAALAG